MRKYFLCLLMALLGMSYGLQAQERNAVFVDGFEAGNLDKWTQEAVVGNTAWDVESVDDNLAYPSNVLQGKFRAFLRNNTGETQGYVTRLISPVMKLDTVYQPILRFWYANPKWTADRDTLRVLYKTAPKANWEVLAVYADAKAQWQKVELQLPNYSETYQIAFEGKDNLGRGIVLDSVVVRSTPECTVPHDITVVSQGAGKVNIAWNASFDANEYELIIATVAIDPDTVKNVADSLIAAHVFVNGMQQNYELTLTSGEYYNAYIRSICEAETSAWNSEDPNQGQYRFRVKATKQIPYYYGFNMDYNPGHVSRDLEWTWGGNTGSYNPFINTHQGETDRAHYSKDASMCVVFTGANNTSTPIPAGKYAYTATPALEDSTNANFALNQCQVRFWSTVYTYTGRTYAHSIIVGVMTDPEDITTFVPVDTVSVWGTSEFVENIVDLSSYQGEGVYIGFLSAFDTRNTFFLDDVTIEYKSNINTPTDIKVNPRDTYADITWNGNASAYKVIITNTEVDPAKAIAEQIVDQATVTTNSYKTEALEADHSWNRPYYVYVQAINGENTSAWSYRYPFVTIASKQEVPYSFDFEQKDGAIYNMMMGTTNTFYPTKIGVFSNDPESPHLYTTNYYKGASCLYLSKVPGNDSWITLPMVEDLTNTQITFYLSGNTTPAQAHATVGIMTNPMDINSFIPVTDFTIATTGYTLCYTNFSNYTGPDGVIAITWTDVDGLAKNTNNYIDELKVEEIAQCLPPVNMQVVAQTDSATISWDKSNATTWEFILAEGQISETQRNQSFAEIAKLAQVVVADTLTWDDPLTDPTFGFGKLKLTTSYNIYVRTLCDEETTWWGQTGFTTPCPEAYPFPYKEDFNQYASSAKAVSCWQFGEYGSATGYPMTYIPSSGAQDGTMLELWSTSTTHRNVVIMPAVEGNLSDMMLKFDVRPWSATGTAYLWIGSMGDITDWTTFVPFDSIKVVGGNEFYKARYDLSQYNPAYNNIAFSSGLGETVTASDILIDNVELVSNNCIEAWNIKADAEPNSLDISWDGKVQDDKWQITVLNKYAALTDTNTIAEYKEENVVVKDSVITGKKFYLDGLKSVTKYYVYIRSLCGDSIWVCDSLKTGCVKLDPTKPNKETFENYTGATSYASADQPNCWTGGNGNPSASTTYLPYIYKGTTYATSGENTYRLYGSTTTNSPAYAASPEIDCASMTELAVTFSYYLSSSYSAIWGVMSDPEDLSTFVILDSIKGTSTSKNTITLDLSEPRYAELIPATAKYFAWRTPYGATGYLYLDDVSITKITCPLPKPSYSGLTASQVRISSGLRTNNEWIALVTTKYMDPDSLAKEDYVVPDSIIAFIDTIDTRSTLVTGLKEQTNYYVAVAAMCDEGISTWATTSFMTPCKPVTPEALGIITFSKKDGYVSGSGADRYLPCWTVGNMSGNAGATSTYLPYVFTTSGVYLHDGDSVLRLYSYVPTSATSTAYNGAYAIMPELDVQDITKYQMNFYARASTTATYGTDLIVGIVTDPSDLNTFVVIDTLTLSHNAYEPFSVSLENYEGDYLGNKGKYIMFLSLCTNVTYNDTYVASISVTAIPSCRPVKEFTVDSIAEDAAVISWKGYTEKYRLLVANEAVADADKPAYKKWVVDSILSTSDSVLLEDLNPNAIYYAYAQGICGEGDSTDISMVYAMIHTDCPSEKGFKAPYYEEFDNNSATGTGKRPDCWEGVQLTFDTVGTTQSYPYVYNIAASSVSSPYVLYFYSYGYWNNTSKAFTTNTKSIAVAPKVQGNLADYMVSFYAKRTNTTNTSTSKYGDKLLLGYVTDASQEGMDSTFVKITEVEIPTTTQTAYQVILSDYISSIPEGARIALKADWSAQGFPQSSEFTGNTYLYAHFYIDNFKIGFPPSCYPPTLEAGVSTLATAEVNITPAEQGGEKWELAVIPDSVYSAKDFKVKDYLDTVPAAFVHVADSANFVVSGLQDGTTYQVHARTVCGGEDGNSAWSDLPLKIRTQYYYKDSYFFGFEKSEGWERSLKSTTDNNYMHPALTVAYSTEGTDLTSSYCPYAIENTTSYVYGYGAKDDDKNKAALRFYAYKSSTTTSYYGGYVVFPGIVEAKARSFEFKARNAYMTLSTMKTSTSYPGRLYVGTIEKGKGFETFEKVGEIYLPMYDTDKKAIVASAENDYLFESYTLDFDSATMADKQVVLYAPEVDPGLGSTYHMTYVDNVTLGAPKGYGMVSINKVAAEATQATVVLDKIGGPWNLYILSGNDTVAKFENTTETSILVTGLTPQTAYTAVLKAASVPENSKFVTSTEKEFKTPCLPMEPNANGEFFWNFNDPSGWERSDVLPNSSSDTAYYKPECFTVGTTYSSPTTAAPYTWLIQRKGYTYSSAPTSYSSTYAHYEYGRNDSPALRIFSSSSTYASATVKEYLVLPELNCSFDTMMIEFYGRCFANYDDTYTTASSIGNMIGATYLGSSYSKSIVVGTLTNPKDFSTLEIIDTLTYNAYTSTTTVKVDTDPNGLRYWQKMQLPLTEAKGKYIVLFQAAYGLFFLDDLSIKPIGDNLFAPGHAATGEITTTTADFSWEVKHPNIQSVVVVLNQEGTAEVLRDTVPGTQTTYTATGLNPKTGYQWYMYQTNGTVNTARTTAQEFYTQCETITPDYKTGFELEDGWRILPAQTSATYKQTMCWTYENAGTSAVGTNTYNYVDATSMYSHSGSYAARLYAYSTTVQTYLAMPEIEDVAAYDTLQINFWMRPGYLTTSTGKVSTQYTYGSTASTAEYYYAKSVIVGTMTDPMDATTFVPIDTITYDGTFTTSDYGNQANDYLYQKKKVVLTGAQGKYVAFMSTLYAKGETRKSTYDYVWIDDVSFSPIQHCDVPTDLSAGEISATGATLSWTAPEDAEKYVLQVSTDYNFAEDTALVFNDTVYTTTQVVNNLSKYTTYAWRVMTICGEDLGESEFSQNATFTTARTPFYGEDFSAATLDADWKFGTNPALLVIDSADVQFNGTSSTSYGWRRITNSYGLYGAHYAAPFYSNSTVTSTAYDYYWMVTPQVYLNDDDSAHLTMNVALTGSSISTPNGDQVTETNMADDFIFIIALSQDGGKTWLKEDILGIWSNALPAGNQLRNIPYTGASLRANLSKYAGKNICIGFYREATTYLASTCAIHIGNIRIANYDEAKQEAEACQYEDIDQNGFFIDGDKVTAGEHTYTRYDLASTNEANAGARDTIYTLNATIHEAVETIIYDTICEGETYSNHDFSGKTTTGLYKRKLQGVNHCDSLACLHLYVNPRAHTNLSYKICQGEELTFDDKFIGQKLDRTGVYYDTLSCVTGCDSVLILSLTVMQPATSEFSATACETEGYFWPAVAKTYTKSGDYTEVLKTVDGCDSTVTMHLTIAKLYQEEIQAEINEGETYTFFGNEYSESGTYTVVVPGQGGECDSTHVLVLTVITAIDNVAAGNLNLTPNIIRAGQSVTAKGNFNGTIHVEVYDIVGRMVLNQDQPAAHNRIVINAFDNSGVYTVRISDKLNEQFVGRVIVQ